MRAPPVDLDSCLVPLDTTIFVPSLLLDFACCLVSLYITLFVRPLVLLDIF